jgi:hypothetical protein
VPFLLAYKHKTSYSVTDWAQSDYPLILRKFAYDGGLSEAIPP